MTRRHMASLAVALLVAGSPSAAARTGPSDTLPALAAVTEIVGSTSTVMLVHVPAPASIALEGPNRNISLSGGGRFFGVALTTLGPKPELVFLAGQFGRCVRRGCKGPSNLIDVTYPVDAARAKIASGSYRLYLITDGTPVRVKLGVQGLREKTVLKPRRPADVAVSDLSDGLRSGAMPVYGSAVKEYRFDQSAMLVSTIWSEAAEPSVVTRGDCLYRGEPPLPAPLAASPACAPYLHLLGRGGYYAGNTQGNGAITIIRPFLRRGPWHYGVWHSVASPSNASERPQGTSGATAVSLELGP